MIWNICKTLHRNNHRDKPYLPGEDTCVGVDIDGGVGQSVEDELLIDDVLAVLDQDLLHALTKGLNGLASESSRF